MVSSTSANSAIPHALASSVPGIVGDLNVDTRLQVFYDGACPVCSREIAFYRARPGADGFAWVDVATTTPQALGPDLSREMALARMHVRRADGTLLSGAAAFAEMWRRMPGFRILGRLMSIPPFSIVAELGYRGFLLARKLWR